MERENIYDLICIGAGPNNLSVGALGFEDNLNILILEKNKDIRWHEGMMINGCTLQNSITKDLVTLADPTSKFSLLNYLHTKKRIYEFIASGVNRILREEYNDYLRWVADNLGNVKYQVEVTNIKDCQSHYEIISDTRVFRAKNICLSLGREISHPFQEDRLCKSELIHSSEYMYHRDMYSDKIVTIIGGGQSGAEIFYDLINLPSPPKKINWITKRNNFNQINESSFDNEYYSPAYVEIFRKLPKRKRLNLLEHQLLTSDGINPELLQCIYQFLYKNKFLNQNNKIDIEIFVGTEVLSIEKYGDIEKLKVIFKSNITNEINDFLSDSIISCTGYKKNSLPKLACSLNLNYDDDRDAIYSEDYSLYSNQSGKIYVLNSSPNTFGINDPNISLCAWRASRVINSVIGYNRYVTPQDEGFI